MKTVDHIVETEVFCCVSRLVDELAAIPPKSKIAERALELLYHPQSIFEDFLGEAEYDRALEFWLVSDWLAEKLQHHGEKVEKDFAGLNVWARMTCGQAMSQDNVIAEIAQSCRA